MLKYTLKRAISVLAGRLSSSVGRGAEQGSNPSNEEASPTDSKDSNTHSAPYIVDKRSESLTVLELTANATPADIKSSYRKLCKKYHPDRFANDPDKLKIANELFTQINAAYEYLK